MCCWRRRQSSRLVATAPRVTCCAKMLEMLERVLRRCADRSGRSAVALLAAVGCGLVLALAGCSGSSGTAAAASPFAGSPYTLMQMNLCLSGLAGCYAKVDYPAGVRGATARIRGARRAAARTVIFGGDVNRRSSCAPLGFWTRTDRSAHQDPGRQQVYGTAAFRSPSARVVPAIRTDHDVLLVLAHLSAQR